MNRRLQCPLCDAIGAREYHADELRPYLRFPRCRLVFVPPRSELGDEEERREGLMTGWTRDGAP